MNEMIKQILIDLQHKTDMTDTERDEAFRLLSVHIQERENGYAQLLDEQLKIDAYNSELREQIADLEAKLAQATQPLTLTMLSNLVDNYALVRGEIAEQVVAVAYAENDEAMFKAQTIANAYADGKITGKNAAQRDLEETLILEADTHYIQKRQDAIEARLVLAQLNARADALRQRISLYKAFLYSQSGIER